MSRDPVEDLNDNLLALRRSIEHVGGTTLSKAEARELNATVAKALERMNKTASEAPQALRSAIRQDLAQVSRTTEEAAARAAQAAVEGVREELTAERLKLAQSAGEARRAAWRSFGGFWAWAASLLATGAFLGLLTAYVTETAETLFTAEQMAPYSCERPWFGGLEGSGNGGKTGCVFWYD